MKTTRRGTGADKTACIAALALVLGCAASGGLFAQTGRSSGHIAQTGGDAALWGRWYLLGTRQTVYFDFLQDGTGQHPDGRGITWRADGGRLYYYGDRSARDQFGDWSYVVHENSRTLRLKDKYYNEYMFQRPYDFSKGANPAVMAGKWINERYEDEVFEFKDNGWGKENNAHEFNWELNGGRLKLRYSSDWAEVEMGYTRSGNALILTGGNGRRNAYYAAVNTAEVMKNKWVSDLAGRWVSVNAPPGGRPQTFEIIEGGGGTAGNGKLAWSVGAGNTLWLGNFKCVYDAGRSHLRLTWEDGSATEYVKR